MSRKDRRKLENLISKVHPFYVETIADAIIKSNYGWLTPYQETIENLSMDNTALSSLNEELTEDNKALTEENTKLFEDNQRLLKALKEVENIAKDFISEENKLKIASEIADMIKEEKQQTIKELITELIHIQTTKGTNYNTEDEIRGLAKKYNVNL